MKLRNMIVVILLVIVLLIAMTVALTLDIPTSPRVQCGLVESAAGYAIVCTDGTIYIGYGGGTG